MFRLTLFLFLFAPGLVGAQDYKEPARGTRQRANLMDAVRPHAVWKLGWPIEFVVQDLRVSPEGVFAFGVLSPQRPGGKAIDFFGAPMFTRDHENPEFHDGTTMHVLFQKSGNTWVAVHWSIGSTDVWWASRVYCEDYSAVIPEFCF